MIAAENGHAEVIKAMGEFGASVNDARNDGATAMLLATQRRYVHVMKVLEEFGVTTITVSDANTTSKEVRV